MQLLRMGIPTIADIQSLAQLDTYAQHVEFNREFLQLCGRAVKWYGLHWGGDPLGLWSRRWEYPFCAQRALSHLLANPSNQPHMLDAGSGVTYFPHLMCSQVPNLTVSCIDSDPSYHKMFRRLGELRGTQSVKFIEAMLQKLPLPDAGVDVICCISVLEHTDNYDEILREFRRVLRPGGLLALTFDLSLDGKFKVSKEQAAEMLKCLMRQFQPEEGMDVLAELNRMDRHDEILTTDYIKRTDPKLLPWRWPLLKGLKDWWEGHGWTGGFHSKSVYCLAARAK